MARTHENQLDYWFLLVYFLSFVTLPFLRVQILGYHVQISMIVFGIYLYVKSIVILQSGRRILVGNKSVLKILASLCFLR